MALPKLNDKPLYDLTIPSTGKNVRYRPFLVKEEKVLLLALESEDPKQMFNAMNDTISACIPDLDVSTLAAFDVEYVFTQLRSKSVGETAKVNIKCSECNNVNEIVIPLADIQVKGLDEKINNIININDEVKVEMKWPNFHELTDKELIEGSDTNRVFNLIRRCMVAILTEEDRILVKDEKPEEVLNFLESMNQEQFGKIQRFIEKMPRLEHDVEFQCSACSHINNHKLQGMQDFF